LYFNGIVLISSVLISGTISFNAGGTMPYHLLFAQLHRHRLVSQSFEDRPTI